MKYITIDSLIYLQDIAVAIVIFTVILFLRKFFTKYIVKVLKTFVKKTKSNIDDKILKVIVEPIRFLIIIIGFKISIAYAHYSSIYVTLVIKSLIIFLVFWTLYDLIIVFKSSIEKFALRFGKDLHQELSLFIIKALKIFIFTSGFVMILQVWNINVSAFIASLGLGGLAFALAAKDTAANLFGGLTLLADKSLKLNDWIKVNSTEGIVEDIGLRTTKIRTFEKSIITVPNQILANSPVENFSRRGIRRIKFRIGLTYETNSYTLSKIKDDILLMLKSHADIAQDATMLVNFDKFEDSNLSIFIYTFTSTSNWSRYLNIREDINIKIMKIVEENKSDFAFNTQTIYLKKEN
jgi:MscS family membrane protein